GTVVWLAVQAPPVPGGHSGDLRRFLLTGPPGAVPVALDEQTGTAGPNDDGPFTALAPGSGVGQVVFGGWVESSGQDRVDVGLMRFDSDDEAQQALAVFFALQARLSDHPGGE